MKLYERFSGLDNKFRAQQIGWATLIQAECLEAMRHLPDASIDAVIVDPPYVGMVNQAWDRKSDEEASCFFQAMCVEVRRTLRFGGRFLSFGSDKTLGWLYPALSVADLKQRELLVIDKGAQVAAGRNTAPYKQHVNVCEYVLVASKFARPLTKQILIAERERVGLSSSQLNALLGTGTNGGGMWSIYAGDNSCQQVPTRDAWEKLRTKLNLPDYETIDEVFNNESGKLNVLRGFSFRSEKRQHPTQKPVALMEYLIRTYTKRGQVVLDNTMGSGTTGVACINTGRRFIGIERETNYFDIACERVADADEL